MWDVLRAREQNKQEALDGGLWSSESSQAQAQAQAQGGGEGVRAPREERGTPTPTHHSARLPRRGSASQPLGRQKVPGPTAHGGGRLSAA